MLGKSKVKYIQSLGHKKLREEEGLFVAEGPKIVHELLIENTEVEEIFAVKEWIAENKKLLNHLKVTMVTNEQLEKISFLTTPNKVLALIKKSEYNDKIIIKDEIILMLDEIQDPGNMGTIIRIADWFGIRYIICSTDSADIYNPKVVQATMGSVARVKVFYTDLILWLIRNKNIRTYAASLEGESVRSINKITKGIIIIGNESRGIRNEILDLANVKITIPKPGKAESLNAAVATGIILSHIISFRNDK